MAGYVGNIPVPQGTQTRQSFTATASQTSFPTIGYTAGFIDVYLNGVKLIDGTDFTASNGSDVVLTTAASANDVLNVVIFDTFDTSSGTFSATTLKNDVTLKNDTEQDTDGGRASKIIYQGEQSGGEISTLAEIQASHDGTADDEKGDLIFRTNDGSDGSSPTEAMRITSDQQLGIGTATPLRSLHVSGAGDTGLMLQTTNAVDDKEIWEIQAAGNASNHADFIIRTRVNAGTGGSESIRLRQDGGLCFGGDFAEANALDDYEEGDLTLTWTGTGGTNDSTNTAFKYTKVGRIVHVSGNTSSATPNATGQLHLAGLPFVADRNSSGSVLYRNITAGTNQHTLIPYIGANQSKIQFYWAAQGTYDELLSTDLNSSNVADFYIGITYITS